MNSSEIKFNAEGFSKVDDSVLETRNQNNFNVFPLNPGDVVVFPEDNVDSYSAPIRKWANADDRAMADKNKTKIEKLNAKGEDNWTEAEKTWYERNKDKVTPETCIPISYYIVGHKPDSADGVLVNITYFNRVGRRTATGKYEPVDGLSKYVSRAGNAVLQKNMLRGKTIKVDETKATWFMREFGGTQDDVEQKSIIIINVDGEESVEQPKTDKAE